MVENHRATMVKTCHTFDPDFAYNIDATGVVRKECLVKMLKWTQGRITFWADKAMVAGQSSACNDLQPGAIIVGQVHIKCIKPCGKIVEREVPRTLPRRSLCRRACWEVIPCDQCKALGKRKK